MAILGDSRSAPLTGPLGRPRLGRDSSPDESYFHPLSPSADRAHDMPRQTYHAKPGEIEPAWHVLDAEGRILGRFATHAATILMGKHRPEYTPHVLSGDFVIVTNAAKIVMTGNKLDDKTLRRYSGYPSGQKVETYRRVLDRDPTRLVRQAIVRMLPSGRLGREIESRLKVYADDKHPHQAQQPKTLEIG